MGWTGIAEGCSSDRGLRKTQGSQASSCSAFFVPSAKPNLCLGREILVGNPRSSICCWPLALLGVIREPLLSLSDPKRAFILSETVVKINSWDAWPVVSSFRCGRGKSKDSAALQRREDGEDQEPRKQRRSTLLKKC